MQSLARRTKIVSEPSLFDDEPESVALATISAAPDRQVAVGRPSNRSRYRCGHCQIGNCERCIGAVPNGAAVVSELVKEGMDPAMAKMTPCACCRAGHPTAKVAEIIPSGRLAMQPRGQVMEMGRQGVLAHG